MRRALGTLPWVEHKTIQIDVKVREVRFALADRQGFNEAAVKAALKGQGFADVTVKAAPGQ